MKQSERISIMRIFADLILADSIIDSGEMKSYQVLKQKYSISKEDEIAASDLTLGDAISNLRGSDNSLQMDLFGDFHKMVISDGFCDKNEALIMLALMYCLHEETSDLSSVVSVKVADFNMEDSQVLYVESKYDNEVNRDISENFRIITQELKIAMFDFVYIPNVAKHYKNTPKDELLQIVSLVAPKFGKELAKDLIFKISNTTTVEFCKEQLCNKLRIRSLYGTDPALMIKISDSQIDGKTIANYLKIDIVGDVVSMIRNFVDRYMGLLSSDSIVISNMKKTTNRFIYSGFYKQIFDIYMLQREIRSTLLIDTIKESISLPELNANLNSLHRKEKAMYLLFLIEMSNGGINFSLPQNKIQLAKYSKRMECLQKKYDLVYSYFGGESGKAPDIVNEKIRRPMLSCIKKAFSEFGQRLHNAEDFTVQRTTSGLYTIYVNPQMVFIYDYNLKKKIHLVDSELFKKVRQIE